MLTVKKGFTKQCNQLKRMAREELSPYSYTIFDYLYSESLRKFWGFPVMDMSVRKLENATRISNKTVALCLKELHEKGFVTTLLSIKGMSTILYLFSAQERHEKRLKNEGVFREAAERPTQRSVLPSNTPHERGVLPSNTPHGVLYIDFIYLIDRLIFEFSDEFLNENSLRILSLLQMYFLNKVFPQVIESYWSDRILINGEHERRIVYTKRPFSKAEVRFLLGNLLVCSYLPQFPAESPLLTCPAVYGTQLRVSVNGVVNNVALNSLDPDYQSGLHYHLTRCDHDRLRSRAEAISRYVR